MSNAFKCDRCGTLYERYEGIEVVSGGYKYNILSISNKFGVTSMDYDICPECMKSLVEWMMEADNDNA